MTRYLFESTSDKFGVAFFTLPLDGAPTRNVSAFKKQGLDNIASFLNPFMNVTFRATGPFQSDLTERDDVILAFLALFLLLLIESLATTIFLRTHRGSISHFGFCIKLFLEHARSFQLQHILPLRPNPHTRATPAKLRLNYRLLSIGSAFLLLTLGLEFAILFLTNPTTRNVLNSTATFRLMQPIMPEWQNLAFHLRGSINRPCESIIIQNVNQFGTRISGCVATSIPFDNITLFSINTNTLQMRITSQLHDYGAEHTVIVGPDSATYSARTFFTLGDRQSRLMRSFETARQEPEQVQLIHAQLIAYLFSSYRNALKQRDSSMNLTRLRELDLLFTHENANNRTIDVLRLPGQTQNVSLRSYVTEVEGVLPDGLAALRLAHQFFRGMSAVMVRPGDEEDLFVESGMGRVRVVSWQEAVRPVNWLSLVIVLVATFVLLLLVRGWVRPVTVSDIAGEYVKEKVGADLGRSPVELGVEESLYFRVSSDGNEEIYQLGAETREGRGRASEEYERSGDMLR